MKDRETPIIPKRNEKGHLLPGETANPTGNNGHLAGWQRYGDRLRKYEAMPFEELDALIKDPKQFGKLSSFDRAAAFQAQAIGEKDHKQRIDERELGLDRIEGKARQSIVLGGDPNNPLKFSLAGRLDKASKKTNG